MTYWVLRNALVLLVILHVISCLTPSGAGGIQLTVHQARQPASLKSDAALPSVLQVVSFRVTISASDFSPIEVSFPSNATSGTISGIPVGSNRSILIEALNSDGRTIRKRTLQGISVSGGAATAVQATLLAVPTITNLKDGSIVPRNRLILQGYAEPGSSVDINDRFQTVTTSLNNPQLDTSPISPSLSDGRFVFEPPLLEVGTHTFAVTDPQTGEQTTLSLTLVDIKRTPGTLLSFGSAESPNQTTSLGINSESVVEPPEPKGAK